jgi:hypothetical protein
MKAGHAILGILAITATSMALIRAPEATGQVERLGPIVLATPTPGGGGPTGSYCHETSGACWPCLSSTCQNSIGLACDGSINTTPCSDVPPTPTPTATATAPPGSTPTPTPTAPPALGPAIVDLTPEQMADGYFRHSSRTVALDAVWVAMAGTVGDDTCWTKPDDGLACMQIIGHTEARPFLLRGVTLTSSSSVRGWIGLYWSPDGTPRNAVPLARTYHNGTDNDQPCPSGGLIPGQEGFSGVFIFFIREFQGEGLVTASAVLTVSANAGFNEFAGLGKP